MNDSDTETSARALSAGTIVGHYEIVWLIGAGGMGEVFRARDTRLSRDVALKIIPKTYGTDNERLRRFAQEARTMGQLNHPNIVSIFDTGEYDRRPYIVSELLEGQTLRQYLESEPQLPIRKVVELGIQIARGLAAAHEKGIIHRDLKPANIFITRDGHLKVLDFGLAKLIHPEWDQHGGNSDTVSAVSVPGTILGSVGYMSPEQVEARPLDSRSDIFSLGVILYEMLTGSRAFSGSSAPATLSAILKDQPPDVAEVRPGVPPALAVIVRRCLEKRPEDRFQSARDLAFSLEELTLRAELSISSATLAAMRIAGQALRRRPAVNVGAVVILTVLLIAVVSATLRSSGRGGEKPIASHSAARVELARVTTSGDVDLAAISPDGKYAAYSARNALWLMHIPTRSSTRLLPEVETTALQFSPDGNYIYFNRQDAEGMNLYRLPVLGGQPQMVVRDVSWSPFTFSRDGGRVAFIRSDSQKAQSSLVICPSNGGTEHKLATRAVDSEFLSCAWSPDGARFVCTVGTTGPAYVMAEVNAATGAERVLPNIFGLFGPQWLPDGSALIGTDKHSAQLWRVGFPDGKPERLTTDLSSYFHASLSVDGDQLAAIRIDTTTNLWSVSPTDPAAMRQLTRGLNTEDGNFGVCTTPDHHIVWASRQSGKSIDLWICDADGANQRRLTFDDAADEKWPDTSRDGRTVVYVRDTTGTASGEIWRVGIEGTPPQRVTQIADARQPHFTADGNAVIFNRAVNGIDRLFEVPLAGGDARQIDSKPAMMASPSPDGKLLLVAVDEKTQRHLELRSAAGGESKRFPYFGFKSWRPDGLAFAFIWPGKGGMNVWLQELDGSPPRQLTRLPPGEIAAWGLAWTRDGSSIVFARRSQTRDVVLLKNLG